MKGQFPKVQTSANGHKLFDLDYGRLSVSHKHGSPDDMTDRGNLRTCISAKR